MNQYQNSFVELLHQATGKQSLAQALVELLSISQDSAYRRIRGETVFSLEESLKLAKHFGISLDAIAQTSSNSIPFNTAVIGEENSGFERYLFGLKAGLEQILANGNAHITYAGEDLPVFYSMQFPALRKFKFAYWNKSILNKSNYQNLLVDEINYPEEWNQLASAISSLYSKVPSLEIWNQDTLKSSIEQFKYYWESGFIESKTFAEAILQDLNTLVLHLEKQADAGYKIQFASGEQSTVSFALFASDLMIGNNCVLVESFDNRSSYVGYNTFNYLFTQDEAFNQEIARWLENLKVKSVLVSQVGEKHRKAFFNSLKRSIQTQIDQL